MIYLLYGLFLLTCIVLIVAILLQPGKADAGALFTSSISSTAFGPRGTQTLLAKITIGAAALFMLGALSLSLPVLTGSRSVVQPESEPSPAASQQQQQTASPAATQQSQSAVPATGNTDASGNANSASPQTSPATQSTPAANANSNR